MKTAATLILILALATSAWATQRIVVDKSNGDVVDAGDTSIQYDSRYYDNMDFADGTIPAGEDPRKYYLSGGNIIKRPAAQLRSDFDAEWATDVKARIDASNLPQAAKDFLKELVDRLVKRLTR